MSLRPSHLIERIEVRYATFRDRPGDERARFAEDMEAVPAAERVLIDTCHRVELVTVDGAARDDGHTLRGTDAIRRVFEVVAGFDSAVVAEEQLIGQVRAAYADALTTGRSGPILNELMRRALRFGRLVRSHARPGTDRSLADPAVAWLRERLRPDERVVVAGTGEMGRLVARRMADAGHPVTVVSASEERGGAVLDLLPPGAHALALGPLRAEILAGSAAVALAVRGRTPALRREHLPDAALPWVLDLSSPAAVDEAATKRLGDRLLDLDRLGRHAVEPVLDPDAEARLRARLEREVAGFGEWLSARAGADALALLHREAEEVRRRHLDRLRRRAGLDDAQLAAVDAASAAMLGELLHGPTVELRHGGADADTVRRLFRIEA